ncbi:MAG: tetratricopeptide repeat protein, partial [Planctomycetota bacterium]
MTDKRLRTGAGYGRETWTVLLLLLLAVLVSTACVLWFMNQAVSNVRLVVRQKLEEAYQGQFEIVRDRLNEHWNSKLDTLSKIDPGVDGAEIFASLVRDQICNSVIVYDEAKRPVYPPQDDEPELITKEAEQSVKWREAEEVEFSENNPLKAAEIYKEIAKQEADDATVARALLAQGRCLAKTGRTDEAIDILIEKLASDRFVDIRDELGRLIVPNA